MKTLLRSPFWRKLARVAGAKLFHWAENNGDADFERNGERWLLKQLFATWSTTPDQTRVIFDVGANLGKYSGEVIRVARGRGVSLSIHAFEPGTAARTALLQRFRDESGFTVVGAAVGERPGRKQLFFDSPGSSQASLINRAQVTDGRGEEVEVIRLRDYMASLRVDRIDLLKLDVEGAEWDALLGMEEYLRPALVSHIQFEYGGATLDAGRRLKDFFDLLESRGYVVAKLFPHSLEVRKYKQWMDHFCYANYVALSAAESRIDRAASGAF